MAQVEIGFSSTTRLGAQDRRRSFLRLGVRVPDEISLVGFDDLEVSLLMDPPLTTVRVYKEEIGRSLMRCLLERLHQPSTRFAQRLLPTELVLRETIRRL